MNNFEKRKNIPQMKQRRKKKRTMRLWLQNLEPLQVGKRKWIPEPGKRLSCYSKWMQPWRKTT